MLLSDQTEEGEFEFQLHIIDSGEIRMLYKAIPIPLQKVCSIYYTFTIYIIQYTSYVIIYTQQKVCSIYYTFTIYIIQYTSYVIIYTQQKVCSIYYTFTIYIIQYTSYVIIYTQQVLIVT